MLVSKCACGRSHLQISLPERPTSDTTAVDCHCRACRRFHAAGFVSYVQVNDNQITWKAKDHIVTYRDRCDALDTNVDRLVCRQCSTKLASQILDNDDDNDAPLDQWLVNLGPIIDRSIPKIWNDHFRQHRADRAPSMKAVWVAAQAGMVEPRTLAIVGACRCGRYRYVAEADEGTELQHCYCRLCRQLSGSAFMTWLPVERAALAWPTGEAPLVRTTDHGQRHICDRCRTCLTIVYDEQPDCVWPAAGSLDDDSLPSSTEETSTHVYRVIHICCRYRARWYRLPEDGLERVQEAC